MRGGLARRSIVLWLIPGLSLLLACRLLLDRDYRRLQLFGIEGEIGAGTREEGVEEKAEGGSFLSGNSRPFNVGEDDGGGRKNGGVSSAYIAGAYMAERLPENESSCIWYHGLPRFFSYPSSKISWTPEIGEKSPYRVLSFILRGRDVDRMEGAPPITLCTHATAEQVYGIVELARRWEGPLSLAVFAPGLDADLAVALLDRACRCETAMSKVSFDPAYPPGRCL